MVHRGVAVVHRGVPVVQRGVSVFLRGEDHVAHVLSNFMQHVPHMNGQ